jgi:hypothetical protein
MNAGQEVRIWDFGGKARHGGPTDKNTQAA